MATGVSEFAVHAEDVRWEEDKEGEDEEEDRSVEGVDPRISWESVLH